MPKLIAFNHITLDGYFTSAAGDMSWAYAGADDPEFSTFVAENAGGGGALLFGRVTYDLMAGYWPTPLAIEQNPAVAEGMNRMTKYVVSRTIEQPPWSNTTLLKGDLVEAVRNLKQQPGPGIAVLGSGSIVAQLAQAGLIDEYQVVVNPVVLGAGRTMFDGLTTRLNLKLANTRTFRNGKVYLCYEPLA